jgi:hypothetical protein
MILYADQVIVSGQPSEDAVPNLLYASDIGKHTSVTHLKKQDGGEVKVVRYAWTHRVYRPNTFSYPFVCPVCRCISPWESIVRRQKKANGSSFTIPCGTKEVRGEEMIRCAGFYVIPAAPSSSPVASPYAGTWLRM